MTLILAIETAGEHLSIAIQSENKTLYSSLLFLPHAHSQLTAALVEAGIHSIGKNMSDISAVAVGSGPGSYTGLRIGLSVAKGICFGCEIPLLSVNGLENMANQILGKFPHLDAVVACLPARKDEFFYAAFSQDGTCLIPPQAGKSGDIQLNDVLFPFQSVIVCGKNAKEFAEHCRLPETVEINESVSPLVGVTAGMAYQKWMKGTFEDVAMFEPAYLKPVYISGR
ncbi:MAG TPA: tRNA (adenosine(37)-N6)-threonylcarbamoyltransferase complex dimerization subunit type 1 TsaB [Catalimonadaceae bacterium]|nr:tRNA (adenosine(37)-N6)-threonylcarbamoyltransferase complex dimerization subunit type 1 TsaB [Catalimonadaceae bacterium]